MTYKNFTESGHQGAKYWSCFWRLSTTQIQNLLTPNPIKNQSRFNNVKLTLFLWIGSALWWMFKNSLAHPGMATQMKKVNMLIITVFNFVVFVRITPKDQHVIAHYVCWMERSFGGHIIAISSTIWARNLGPSINNVIILQAHYVD